MHSTTFRGSHEASMCPFPRIPQKDLTDITEGLCLLSVLDIQLNQSAGCILFLSAGESVAVLMPAVSHASDREWLHGVVRGHTTARQEKPPPTPEVLLPFPSPGPASAQGSSCPRRGVWPAAWSPHYIGIQAPHAHHWFCNTRAGSFSPAHSLHCTER